MHDANWNEKVEKLNSSSVMDKTVWDRNIHQSATYLNKAIKLRKITPQFV